jgi:hypothetical protein
MRGKLVWVAYTMFREYYISTVDGRVYETESAGINTSFNPKPCDTIPYGAEYIICTISR